MIRQGGRDFFALFGIPVVLVVALSYLQWWALRRAYVRLAKGVLDGGRGRVRWFLAPESEGRFRGRTVRIARVSDHAGLLLKLRCRTAIQLTIAHRHWATRIEKCLFHHGGVVVGDASLDEPYLFTADQPGPLFIMGPTARGASSHRPLMGGGTDRIELKRGALQATHSGYSLRDVAEIKVELEDLDALVRSLEEVFPTSRA